LRSAEGTGGWSAGSGGMWYGHAYCWVVAGWCGRLRGIALISHGFPLLAAGGYYIERRGRGLCGSGRALGRVCVLRGCGVALAERGVCAVRGDVLTAGGAPSAGAVGEVCCRQCKGALADAGSGAAGLLFCEWLSIRIARLLLRGADGGQGCFCLLVARALASGSEGGVQAWGYRRRGLSAV